MWLRTGVDGSNRKPLSFGAFREPDADLTPGMADADDGSGVEGAFTEPGLNVVVSLDDEAMGGAVHPSLHAVDGYRVVVMKSIGRRPLKRVRTIEGDLTVGPHKRRGQRGVASDLRPFGARVRLVKVKGLLFLLVVLFHSGLLVI